mgnify:CR=1 FL=1
MLKKTIEVALCKRDLFFFTQYRVSDERTGQHEDPSEEEWCAGKMDHRIGPCAVKEKIVHDRWPDNGGQAHHTRHGTLHLTLFIRRYMSGKNGLNGRSGNASETIRDQEYEDHPALSCKREQEKAETV